MRTFIWCLVFALACAACATSTDHCQGSIQQINTPPATTVHDSGSAADGSTP